MTNEHIQIMLMAIATIIGVLGIAATVGIFIYHYNWKRKLGEDMLIKRDDLEDMLITWCDKCASSKKIKEVLVDLKTELSESKRQRRELFEKIDMVFSDIASIAQAVITISLSEIVDKNKREEIIQKMLSIRKE